MAFFVLNELLSFSLLQAFCVCSHIGESRCTIVDDYCMCIYFVNYSSRILYKLVARLF